MTENLKLIVQRFKSTFFENSDFQKDEPKWFKHFKLSNSNIHDLKTRTYIFQELKNKLFKEI